MKTTELRIFPENKNPVVEMGIIEGDFNLLNQMLEVLCKAKKREKLSYIFRIEYKGETNYKFYLSGQEYEQALKYIPNFNF